MSNYIITEQDIKELDQYKSCNEVSIEFYAICQTLIRKRKWSASDLRILNQCLEDGLGHLLYQLFEVKAKQPLFMKYYGTDPRINPQRSMEELMVIKELIINGSIQPEDYAKYGLRLRTVEQLIPNHERKDSAINVKISKKRNTHLSKI